jgi:hypothetical protein
MPISFIGAACLLAARRHIERDTAKIFEAVVAALAKTAGPVEPT